AQRILAKNEGVFAEPSGVTSLAGLMKIVLQGELDRSDSVVVEITGSGLKDPSTAMRGMVEIPTINASMDELEKILKTTN
ncbi:MAG: threonine synthase, partial [Candidatus Bathyarchaeia archaeon]